MFDDKMILMNKELLQLKDELAHLAVLKGESERHIKEEYRDSINDLRSHNTILNEEVT